MENHRFWENSLFRLGHATGTDLEVFKNGTIFKGTSRQADGLFSLVDWLVDRGIGSVESMKNTGGNAMEGTTPHPVSSVSFSV